MARLLVTGCGLGYLPLAPGTWGSLAAVWMAWMAHWVLPAQERTILAAGVGLLIVPSVVSSTWIARLGKDQDPSEIVIDEIIGQLVCLLWLPISLFSLGVGFLTFRLFDILKPFPIPSIERLPGGLGIVCDDLVAGLYAGLSSRILIWFVWGA